MLEPLEREIVRTVLWFSMSNYPLTSFEIWKWMLEPQERYKLEDVILTLDRSKNLSRLLSEKNGLFSIRGFEISFELRHDCFIDAVEKMKRARRVVKFLRLIPTIRGVAVCNNLSWMNTSRGSDIDFLVIARDGSIWTTRLLSVMPFKILGLRPGGRTKHPLCFSFFLSDANLNIESLLCAGGDPYLAYWVMSLVPIFDRDDVFAEMWESNKWAESVIGLSYVRAQSDIHRKKQTHVDVPSWVENLARKLQKKMFPQVVTQMANRDNKVVVSDAMLKFHANDRREFFKERHKILCNELGV